MPNTQYTSCIPLRSAFCYKCSRFLILTLIVETEIGHSSPVLLCSSKTCRRNHLSYSISGQNNVQFHHSKHHTLWTWKLFPSHICLDLNSKSTEIWPIWNVNIFCLCARTLFMRGIVSTLHIMHPEVNKHLWALFNNPVPTVRRLNHQKNWNAPEGLFCLFNFYGYIFLKRFDFFWELSKLSLVLTMPTKTIMRMMMILCRWRWWWWWW